MKHRSGDSIGTGLPAGTYHWNAIVKGILVEPGDRVQVRRSRPGVGYAAWGSVTRGYGFGMVGVRLDDGREFKFSRSHLEFAKSGRPPLVKTP